MPPQTATVEPLPRADISESIWRKLLGRIRDGLVVPVLGTQLLDGTGDAPGLQAFVAKELLAARGRGHEASSLTLGSEVHEVVTRLRPTVPLQDLYEEVHEAISAYTRQTRVPKAIEQLAEISDFRLLVTVTPDDMLASCLRRRCGVHEIVHSPNRSISGTQNDLPRDWEQRAGEAHLLYLFGKSQRTPVFAIHEEDVLEYAHNMIARGSNVPVNFLTELQSKDLLFIGCRFPDWLSRFFIRATNKERLSLERRKREWLIEGLAPEASLTVFLAGYSKYTEVLSHAVPAAFVEQLHERWTQLDQPASEQRPRDPAPLPRKRPRRAALFFISYSRETDQGRAQALYQALRDLGVREHEIWFDHQAIQAGNDYATAIRHGIEDCEYFLPLLSLGANGRDEAFVFSEWDAANERLPRLNREFIVPIVVDTKYEPERYDAIPTEPWRERNIDFGHAPGGLPDAKLLKRLRDLLRTARERGDNT